MDLFSRAVKVFTENGNALSDDDVEEVQKSLFSAGRIGEFNKVLKVMEHENDGFVAIGLLQGTIAFRLRAVGYNEQADEFANRIEESRWSTPYLRMKDYILFYRNFELLPQRFHLSIYTTVCLSPSEDEGGAKKLNISSPNVSKPHSRLC